MIDTIDLREIVLEEIHMPPMQLVEADAVPVLDETGNPVRDELGREVYA
jgi:hypothetical protein